MASFTARRLLSCCCSSKQQPRLSELSRDDFPANFVFGVATSAYQVEGAVLTDGRSMSIWDSFSHIPGNIYDGSTGDVACDHYHRYKSDTQLMVDLGIDAYRLSISWSRIFPDTTGAVNQAGVSFYNKVINDLVHKGIKPYLTLYHWDMPQHLENDPEVMGWRTKRIITHFVHFAETCFKLFGDRVKNWITINEIWSIAVDGYGFGTDAPGRCSAVSGTKKKVYTGDSATEPYIVAHNALLSHAAAVKVYREKFQPEQKGRIGMVANSKWYEPFSEQKEDIHAAERCLEFELAWILDPILMGDYPASMRRFVASRLPCLTEAESKELKGSVDFVGLNYYTANYAQNIKEEVNPSSRWYSTDRQAKLGCVGADGELIGETMGPADIGWIYNCPWGLPKLLGWMEARYGKREFEAHPIIIAENGCMDLELDLSLKKALHDEMRVKYLNGTLQHLSNAIKDYGYDVQGFFLWSLLDNFEWSSGLVCRFGLYYVDHQRGNRRYPKLSARWYQQLLSREGMQMGLVKT
ncbi:hypothetical protein GOP47_0011837 [Adiantum capillus-veneris]|uniref:Beta-glucosidase n=2 Tax=Adiantum capillus-veneris TaxID=13818 RepID=A0A9D4ZFR8_ADICA|nr:hypothetical protein GOP47_0011837 [Adiantum capillus-veneris]